MYKDFVSKSGAVTKVRTPEFRPIAISLPETLYSRVTTPSKSTSVAETVPIAVWFSATVNAALVDITGELLLVSTTLTVLVAVPALLEASVDV